jgi:glyoxylase-like metal-dependent hydrolase (beta-lactamase superfamily II)
VPARQILDHVWLVGSGADEVALTDPHDCHAYLLWDRHGGVLVDAGTGIAAGRWLAHVREVCDPARLSGVLVTHYHADHAGGCAAARAAGLAVHASGPAAHALATGDEERTQLARARSAGIYPAGYRLPPARVDRILTGGEVLTAGSLQVEVIDAPGHCDGHLVFLAETGGARVLFSGDCVFADGRVSIQAIPDCRLDVYERTVTALAGREVDALLPGHGPPVLSGAGEHLRRAAEPFGRLVPPANLLS